MSGNNVTEFDKEANGALWTVPINTRTWASGKIGVVTNSQIRITLKKWADAGKPSVGKYADQL